MKHIYEFQPTAHPLALTGLSSRRQNAAYFNVVRQHAPGLYKYPRTGKSDLPNQRNIVLTFSTCTWMFDLVSDASAFSWVRGGDAESKACNSASASKRSGPSHNPSVELGETLSGSLVAALKAASTPPQSICPTTRTSVIGLLVMPVTP